MRHQIRASALAVRDNGLLLVRHVVDGREWWCPPGGGVEGDEPLLNAAKRELNEETGITASDERVVYLPDFLVQDPPCRNLEVYVLMGEATGEADVPSGESCYLKEARFFGRDELVGETVYPAALRHVFWEDLASNFPEARYLGVKTFET